MKSDYGDCVGWDLYTKLLKKVVVGENVLDVGCGNGSLGTLLNCKSLIGVDKHFNGQEMKDYDKLLTINIENQYLPFNDNEFDTVFCLEVFQYIKRKNLSHVIEELKRVTKGNLIISFPNYNCITIRSILSNNLRKSFLTSLNNTRYATNKDTFDPFGNFKIKYISCRWGLLRNWWGNILASEVVGVWDK